MSTIKVTNLKQESSSTNNLVLTSGGDTQITGALGLGGATYGTSGQVLTSAGSGAVPTWQTLTDTTGWTWDTTGNTFSGSSVSITGIPSTATQIIVTLRDMSLASNTNVILRAGTSSGLASTGYVANGFYIGTSNSNQTSTFTNGWSMWGAASAAYAMNGVYNLTKITGNVWNCHGNFSRETTSTNTWQVQGHVELGGTLDRVGLVPTTGTFDGGSVFVHYFSP